MAALRFMPGVWGVLPSSALAGITFTPFSRHQVGSRFSGSAMLSPRSPSRRSLLAILPVHRRGASGLRDGYETSYALEAWPSSEQSSRRE